MRRAIEIIFLDGTIKELELSKATSIKANIGMLHLDRLDDGTWRLIFSDDITTEFKNIQAINIIRED